MQRNYPFIIKTQLYVTSKELKLILTPDGVPTIDEVRLTTRDGEGDNVGRTEL